MSSSCPLIPICFTVLCFHLLLTSVFLFHLLFWSLLFLVTILFSGSSHLLPLLIPYILLVTLLVWSTYNWLQFCRHVPCLPLVYLFPSVSLFSCSIYFSCIYLFPSVSLFSYSIYFLVSTFSHLFHCFLIPSTFLSLLIPICFTVSYSIFFSCLYLFPSVSLSSCPIYFSGRYLFPSVSLFFLFHLLFWSLLIPICFTVFLFHLLSWFLLIPICFSVFFSLLLFWSLLIPILFILNQFAFLHFHLLQYYIFYF